LEIGPVDLEIIDLQATFYKRKKLMQAKHIALSASLLNWLNKTNTKTVVEHKYECLALHLGDL